jgi:hypothetical protein
VGARSPRPGALTARTWSELGGRAVVRVFFSGWGVGQRAGWGRWKAVQWVKEKENNPSLGTGLGRGRSQGTAGNEGQSGARSGTGPGRAADPGA